MFNFLHRLVRVSKVKEVLEAARRPEGEQGPPVAYPRSVPPFCNALFLWPFLMAFSYCVQHIHTHHIYIYICICMR